MNNCFERPVLTSHTKVSTEMPPVNRSSLASSVPVRRAHDPPTRGPALSARGSFCGFPRHAAWTCLVCGHAWCGNTWRGNTWRGKVSGWGLGQRAEKRDEGPEVRQVSEAATGVGRQRGAAGGSGVMKGGTGERPQPRGQSAPAHRWGSLKKQGVYSLWVFTSRTEAAAPAEPPACTPACECGAGPPRAREPSPVQPPSPSGEPWLTQSPAPEMRVCQFPGLGRPWEVVWEESSQRDRKWHRALCSERGASGASPARGQEAQAVQPGPRFRVKVWEALPQRSCSGGCGLGVRP